MPDFKFRTIFPKDLNSSIIPVNLSKYARIGVIVDVNVEEGLCTVKWYDRPSYRQDVIITQGSPGSFAMPRKGTVVVVVFDINDRAFIASYITLGHEDRVKNLKTLPKLKEEDKFFEVGGSYLYLRQNGDVIISTLTGGIFLIENSTGSLKEEFVNWRMVTEGGIFYSGLIKRLKLNEDGSKSLEVIEDPINNQQLVEYDLKIMECADGELGVSAGIEPILQITLGNVISSDGYYVDKNDDKTIPYTYPQKQICARLKLKSGVQIDIDKEGKISIKNAKININNGLVDFGDEDVSRGVVSDGSNVIGSKGQHAARQHDRVTIPIGNTREDLEHRGLVEKNIMNYKVLNQFVVAIVSPSGPCFLNSSLLTPNMELFGEITEGAKDIYIGDNQ